MKRLVFLTLTFLLFKPLLYSQLDFVVMAIQTVHYQYDEVGNRIEKGIFLLKSGNANQSVPAETQIKDQSFRPIDVMIYPNPTDGQISVEIRTNEQNMEADECFQVGIFDLQGRKVKQKSIIEGEMTVIDLGNEPEGIYILMIWNKDVISSWKVVKR